MPPLFKTPDVRARPAIDLPDYQKSDSRSLANNSGEFLPVKALAVVKVLISLLVKRVKGPSVKRLAGFYLPLRAFGLPRRAQNS